MKVRDEMLGHPAKCVACRQKIRIPRLDEIPSGATELRLDDYPEFLRKAAAGVPGGGDSEKDIVALGDDSDDEEAVALDVLEPLRLLCSLEHKYAQAGRDGEEVPGGSAVAIARIRAARVELDEVLRKWLCEVTEELAGVCEELAQLGLAVRTGDRDFVNTRDRTLELRSRRDRLERRRLNLRGWLVCEDPYLAGGYLSHASLDRVPKEGFRVTFPPEPDIVHSLVDEHIGTLRDAMYRKEQAVSKLAETEEAVSSGRTGWQALAPNLAAAIAERKRTTALVAFARDRVERLRRDLAGDEQAIEAQLELGQRRLAVSAIDHARFREMKRGLHAEAAAVREDGKALSKALLARFARDIHRRRRSRSARGRTWVGPDLWFSWAAAVLFAVAVFLPIGPGVSPLSALRVAPAPLVRWLLFGLLSLAAGSCAAGFVSSRAARALLLWGLWVIALLWAALWMRAAALSTGAADLGMGGGVVSWLLHPAPGAMAVALACMTAGAWTSLAAEARLLRLCGAFSVAVAVVAAAGLFLISGSFEGPRLSVSQESVPRVVDAGLMYETRIEIMNRGRRAFRVVQQGEANPGVCRYEIERQMTTGVWTSAGAWREARFGGGGIVAAGQEPEVNPGDSVVFVYDLAPGNYRVRLSPSGNPAEAIVSAFDLVDQPPPVQDAPVADAPDARDAEDAAAAEPQEDAASAGAIVKLKGLASAKGQDPRFIFSVELPEGGSVQRDVTLGMEIYDGWMLMEYNPDNQAATLSKNGQLFILRRGTPLPLPSETAS